MEAQQFGPLNCRHAQLNYRLKETRFIVHFTETHPRMKFNLFMFAISETDFGKYLCEFRDDLMPIPPSPLYLLVSFPGVEHSARHLIKLLSNKI